jgi:hypothetical protein
VHVHVHVYLFACRFTADPIFSHPVPTCTHLLQTSPPPFHPDYVNYNMLSEPVLAPIVASLNSRSRRWLQPDGSNALPVSSSSSLSVSESTFTPVFNMTHLSIGRLDNHYDDHRQFTVDDHQGHDNTTTSRRNDNATTIRTGFEHPHSLIVRPVHEQIHDKTSRIVGLVHAIVSWDVYLVDLLASDLVIPKNGFYGVLRNSCGQSYTYAMDGHSVSVYFPYLHFCLGPRCVRTDKCVNSYA